MRKQVDLTDIELKMAAMLGQFRMEASRDGGMQDKAGARRNLEMDVLGAECEMAFAKLMGMYPGFGVNTFKAGDVGNIQVRGTTVITGNLILRPNDNPKHVYVLVLKRPPAVYEFPGWVTGGRGMQIGKWEVRASRDAAWWVKQEQLNDMGLLNDYLAGKLTGRPAQIQ